MESRAGFDGNSLLESFSPLGYPHVFCVKPRTDGADLLEETWFYSWLSYFSEWDLLSEQNKSLRTATNKTVVEVATIEGISAEVNLQNARYLEEIAEISRRSDEIDKLIVQRRSEISTLGNSFVAVTPSYPPFKIHGEYEMGVDPFLEVIRAFSEDVSAEDWATNEMRGGKFMDADMAKAVRLMNGALDNPDSIENKALRDQIVDLKRRGFARVNATSGTRSPLRQAYLYNEARKNSNPVARYVGSKHMTGQAIDVKLPPNGWGWGSENHAVLRSVAKRFGLDMGVAQDPVHAELANPSQASRARALAIGHAYVAQARTIRLGQVSIRDDLVFNLDKAIAQKAQLQADLETRRKVLYENTSLFARISAQYQVKRLELQSLDAELQRRQYEQAARERAGRRDSVGGPPVSERPSARPAPVERPTPPVRERPPRDDYSFPGRGVS